MLTRHPRFRQFEPLITSQLRLRNLIKITGINFHFEDDEKFSVYFTLHLSAYSKPFYTSERVDYRKKVEWPEINCPQFQNSSHKFVCIRVWRCDNIKGDSNDSSADKMLFLWGVCFSGLVSVTSQTEFVLYKRNTLFFHLYGDIFTAPEQIIINPTAGIPLNCDHDSDKFSSSSNFSQSNESNYKVSPPSSPSKSLENHLTNENNGPASYETLNELKQLRKRYVKLSFPKNEIQRSYTVEKLLQIQEMQRRIRLKQESSKMLADRICMKSASCLNLELITSKPVFYEPQKQPGMGRTLSLLLSQQKVPPKPEIIMKIHELRSKIESAKFRIKMLSQERDNSRHFNKSLEVKREKLKDENTETETMTWNSLRTLSRDNVKTHQNKLALQRDVIMNVQLALGETRRCLLKELNEIYHIEKSEKGCFTINGLHLPDAESYDEITSTPTEISIALGYVAHAVLIVSKILNIPLRNPILHEGSRSKIIDNIKILPPTDRIFPLFCRSASPSNVLLYGVFLLNQNISQLKHIVGMVRGDLRATLANLFDLMNGIGYDGNRTYGDNGSTLIKHVDNSASSVDSVPMNILLNLPTSLSSSSPRVSRSLDDFDDHRTNDFETKFNSSAPDLMSLEQTE